MAKEQEKQEELSTDFFSEVEMEINDNLEGLDDEEEESSDDPEVEDTDDEEDKDLNLVDDDDPDKDEDDEGDDDDPLDEDVPLVKEIQQALGYEFDKEFEDTEEGIQQLVQASSEKLADEQLARIFEQYPDVQELLEYRRLGGNPDKFLKTKFPEVDYTTVEFNEEDSSQHEDLVRRELKVRGYSDEEIEAEVEDYKNGGILDNKAKRALSALRTKQQEDQDNLLEEQREADKQKQQNVEKFWNDVKEDIASVSNLKGFTLPAKDKDSLFDYISKPVDGNKSQRDLDVEDIDRETQLAMDYLLFKGFDLSSIVDRKAKDKNAKKLRERMNQRKLDRKKEEDEVVTGANVELGTL